MATLRGADILARALAGAGVRHLFSLSGNQIMPVYDAALDARLSIVHVRHEGAAVHMADAWGRLTGEPGVALLTGGPGHANGVGALYTAAAAESPMVLLSGHAPLAELGRGAFQEMRQADLAAPVTKASWTAQRAESLSEDIERALRIARAGRPGPVHVSLPFDVLEAKVADSAVAPAAAGEPGGTCTKSSRRVAPPRKRPWATAHLSKKGAISVTRSRTTWRLPRGAISRRPSPATLSTWVRQVQRARPFTVIAHEPHMPTRHA